MKVRIVYRNYKPLHAIYESLVAHPPQGVEYVYAQPITRFKPLYKVSKWFRYLPFATKLIRLVESTFFLRKNSGIETVDLLHYVNIIDSKIPELPYVVDMEHAASLINFVDDTKRINKVFDFLHHENCRAVNCLSLAARRTLKELLGDRYGSIAKKVSVIYPALEEIDEKDVQPNYQYIRPGKKVNVLLVGNQAYLKGLEEVLVALSRLKRKKIKRGILFHIVSADAQELVRMYNLQNVRLYEPTYSKKEILEKFFMPADVFIMPTKEDTFGMAILDSLVSGTPVITTDQFAMPELVEDGKDGILLNTPNALLDRKLIPSWRDMKYINSSHVDEKLVKQIESVLLAIANEDVPLKTYSKRARGKFSAGQPFSIAFRNKKLLALYKKAVKST